ncbi:hypothetical protein CCMSSC00406_0005639 [Pleurotus cornucopiae]|uniref:Uncharacterized protein n=1 Tax=Pleurotus cornucopiae TaxID=5321 RepID=A0ACB7IV51_PLECO|nr:hypothetical protein CCMSSC00406_0005639 [Pleurotus cornucopiae]
MLPSYLSATCRRSPSLFRTFATATKEKQPHSQAKTQVKLRPTASASQTTAKPKVPSAVKGKVSSEHAAKHPSQPASQVHSHPESTKPHAKVAPSVVTSGKEREKEKSEEEVLREQMAQIDQMLAMEKLFPTTDPWAQRVDTLDVELPYAVNPFKPSEYPSWRSMFEQFSQNRQHSLKNATSMWSLAGANAFPGVDLSGAKFRHKLFKWPWHVFQCRSTKPNAWVAPFRAGALESYIELNNALAANDVKRIKTYAIDSYQDTQLKLLKKRSQEYLYKWRFHGELSPTRILSIRAMEGYLSPEEPRFGNRFMAHILVKFDTEQSLEIYDRKGHPLHAHKPEDDHGKKTWLNVPAKKRRVIEYLVLEKRMWYDGPWTFRDQLWEKAGKARVAA